MKILLGVHQFFPHNRTGTEVLTLELARGLQHLDHSVQIFAGEAEDSVSDDSGPWLTQDTYAGFDVHRLHYGMQNRGDPIALHSEAPARVQLFRELATQLKPDIVHFNHILGFSAQVVSEAQKLGIPTFLTATDFWTVCPKITLFRAFDNRVCDGPGTGLSCIRCFSPVPTWLAQLAHIASRTPIRWVSSRLGSVNSLRHRVGKMMSHVNQSHRIFTSTRFLAEVLIRHGVNRQRVKVIPYGVELGALPEKLPVPPTFSEDSPLRLGFIGTFSPLKGLHVLLRALALMGEASQAVHLDCYGSVNASDPYFQEIHAISNSMAGVVTFKGTFPHGEIGRILRGVHLLVIPSVWYESAPLVLCSALSAGTPVLVSALGGLTEVVKEGDHGFSFPSGDTAALSSLILRLIENRELLTRLNERTTGQARTTLDYVKEIESEYLSVKANEHSQM